MTVEQTLILSVETATRAGSVALTRGEKLISWRRGDAAESHSNRLLQHVQEVLDEGKGTLREVELFAVASGPGSFTGLRIGLATIKSFAATLERPCVGVPTLSAVAYAAGLSARTVAVLPAGRGEVFAQLFEVNGYDKVVSLDEPAHITPQKLLDKYGHLRNLLWAGEGAHIHTDAIRKFAGDSGIAYREVFESTRSSAQLENSFWMLAPPRVDLAVEVAALAFKSFQAGDDFRPEKLSAIYVRPSDAELKGKCPEQNQSPALTS
ncbi:MAG: tRNA (adenosine(37)-N6)-threonylcarbamoyltransferase complex dimerization subunit type 1 TsaB [Pyrinomonadaceae bacterium]